MAEANMVSLGVDFAPMQQALRNAQHAMNEATTQMANRFDRMVSAMKGATAALGAVFLVMKAAETAKAIVDASDAFQQLKAQLRNTAAAGTDVDRLFEGVKEAAQRARMPVADFTTAFVKFSKSMQESGYSEGDAIRFTESLAKGLQASGVAGQQAAAVMLQLSQAFNAGRLQGDEFRSVIENWPDLLRIVRQETGKTGSELRKMGEDGRIAVKTMVDAVANNTAAIDAKFAAMPQTAANAWSLMVDQVATAVGQMADTSKVSEAWANALNEIRVQIGPTFESAVKLATEATAVLGRVFQTVASYIGEAVIQVKAWSAFIQSTDVYRVFVSALEAIKAAFSGIREAASFAWSQLQDGGQRVFPELTGAFARVTDEVAGYATQLREVAKWQTTVNAATDVKATEATVKKKVEFGEATNAPELRKRMQLMIEIARLEDDLARAEAENDPLRAQALKTQLEIRQKISKEMREASPALARELEGTIAVAKATETYAQALQRKMAVLEEISSSVMSNIEGQMRRAFEGGKVSFKDMASSMLTDLAMVLNRALVLQPVLNGLGMTNSKGVTALSAAGDNTGLFDGMIAALPKFHSGLKPSEFPAILQRGEAVLTKQDTQRTMSALGSAGRSGNGMTNYIDARGADIGVADRIMQGLAQAEALRPSPQSAMAAFRHRFPTRRA